MPERIFKYNSVPELQGFAKALAQAVVSGSTQELRSNHTGFLVRTGPLTKSQLFDTLRDVRYEIYFRGKCLNDAACQSLEPTDPRKEKIMHVEVNRSIPTPHLLQGFPAYLF
jgi:hypothetical protein